MTAASNVKGGNQAVTGRNPQPSSSYSQTSYNYSVPKCREMKTILLNFFVILNCISCYDWKKMVGYERPAYMKMKYGAS